MNLKWAGSLVGAALLISSAAAAFDNEPDGFRGIKWGTPFSAHAKELTLVEKGKDENYYLRKGEKMSIGGAELKQLAYGYWKNQFVSVFIETLGVGNKSALLEAFRAQFGQGYKPNQFLDEYLWRGATTTMSVKCSPIGDKCKAFLFSTELMAKQSEESKKAAAGAAKDF